MSSARRDALDDVPFARLPLLLDDVLEYARSGGALPIREDNGTCVAVVVSPGDYGDITAYHERREVSSGVPAPARRVLSVGDVRGNLPAVVTWAGLGSVALITDAGGEPLGALVSEADWDFVEEECARRMFAAARAEGDDGVRHSHEDVFHGGGEAP